MPEDLSCAQRYLIFDHDSIFSDAVAETMRSIGIKPVRTAYRSRWQNLVAERWIQTLRHELLDRVILLDDEHLRRMATELID